MASRMQIADQAEPTSGDRPSRVDWAFEGEALLSALRPYAKVSRLPGRIRVIDVTEPYLVDMATRQLVAEHLRPLLLDFFGAEQGPRFQQYVDKFDRLDRVLIVIGAEQHDLRGWFTYTMLNVHRRPVIWIQRAAVRPGLQSTRVVPLVLGPAVMAEWLRHGCRPIYIAGTTRNAQLMRFLRSIWGESRVHPRRDGVQPPDVRRITEVLGVHIVHQLQCTGFSPHAGLDIGKGILRNGFGGEASVSDGAPLGSNDAYMLVVRAPIGPALARISRVPGWLRAGRRAEARIRARRGSRGMPT